MAYGGEDGRPVAQGWPFLRVIGMPAGRGLTASLCFSLPRTPWAGRGGGEQQAQDSLSLWHLGLCESTADAVVWIPGGRVTAEGFMEEVALTLALKTGSP